MGLAAIMLAGTLWIASAGAEVPVATSGPAVALDLAGKTVDPLAMAAGKPLVLIFVRTDCPISNRYAPTIQALGQKYSNTAVIMLVYPDKSETPQNIRKHLHEYGYKATALRDSQHALVKLGKVEVSPVAAVFNANGELIYHGRIDNWYKEFGRARSAPTTHELEDAIQSALNSQHPAPASVSGIGCYISDLQ